MLSKHIVVFRDSSKISVLVSNINASWKVWSFLLGYQPFHNADGGNVTLGMLLWSEHEGQQFIFMQINRILFDIM